MLSTFLDFLQNSNNPIFIEVEGKIDKINKFLDDYNKMYNQSVSPNSEGVCVLGHVDKWGIELRIYFNDITDIPEYWNERKYRNRRFRADQFAYRLDDNELVKYLFQNGYRLGYN